MSKQVRAALEQSYAENKVKNNLQITAVSFSDQAEVRADFDIFCKRKGVTDPILIQLTPFDYYSPLCPILYIIKILLKRTNIKFDELPGILGLEQFERIILLSILNNHSTIKDFYMPSDMEYIRFRLRRHIIAIFNHLISNTEPTFIGITHLENIGPSSLAFLLEMVRPSQEPDNSFYIAKNNMMDDGTSTKKIHNLFANYDDSNHEKKVLRNNPNCIMMISFGQDNISPEWLDWESRFERSCYVVRPDESDNGFETDNTQNPWTIYSFQAKEIKDVKEVIERCNILLNYFCNEEVIKLINATLKILRLNKTHDNKFNDMEQQLHHLIGRAHLYKREYEDALIAFDLMYENAQYSNNNDEACKAYIELAYTHIFRSDFEAVLHFAEMATHLGEVSMNMRLVAISNFCLFVAYDRSNIRYGLHNINTLLSNLERQDLLKEQTYVLRNSFAQASLDPNITLKMALDNCNKAVTIASRCGITHELAASNHCRGIVLSMLNRFADALPAYRLSEEQYNAIEVPIDLTHVYNSIGFLLRETEDYLKAHEYYLKALRNSIKLNDYSEISITLYNLSRLYFCCGKFSESIITLNILQEVMSIRGTYTLPFHNVHHIILSKAQVYINLNQINLAEQMLKRSYNLRNIVPLHCNELFLHNLLQAVIYSLNGSGNRTSEEFKTKTIDKLANLAEQLKEVSLTPQEQMTYYLSVINIYHRFNYFEKAYRYFRKGFALAVKSQLFNSQKMLVNTWNQATDIYKDYESIQMPLSEISQVVPLVEQERKVNVLWKQVHEMRLISMLHNFSLNVQTYEQLAGETLRLLSSHFNINGGMIYFADADLKTTELIKQFNTSKEFPDFKFERIGKFIENHINTDTQEFNDLTIGDTDIHHLIIYPLLDCDKLIGQMLLFTFERKTDDRREEFDSISFIAQQLSSQLMLMIQRIKLIKVSTTDMLTGLYNRMEFHNQLHTVIEKISPVENIALGFMDLDNFKYYNDNLGHDVGDKLLVWFAELINTIKTPGDIACRWGGDEFLLLMKHCNADEAQRRMQNVLDALKAKLGYKKEIAEFLGHPIDNLPERYYLSCSIGVMDSSSLPRPFTQADLLTHADKALYEVKRTGKGKVLNYENMTHVADDKIYESNR